MNIFHYSENLSKNLHLNILKTCMSFLTYKIAATALVPFLAKYSYLKWCKFHPASSLSCFVFSNCFFKVPQIECGFYYLWNIFLNKQKIRFLHHVLVKVSNLEIHKFWGLAQLNEKTSSIGFKLCTGIRPGSLIQRHNMRSIEIWTDMEAWPILDH